MIKQTIQAIIVDNSQGEKCDARCGMDWSSAETIDLAKQQMKDSFGDKIQLEYLDLSKPIANHRVLSLSQTIRDKNLSLPLLVIDGQPRISGQFDIRQLLNVIKTEREIRNEPRV